jgi:hypothetical protein
VAKIPGGLDGGCREILVGHDVPVGANRIRQTDCGPHLGGGEIIEWEWDEDALTAGQGTASRRSRYRCPRRCL